MADQEFKTSTEILSQQKADDETSTTDENEKEQNILNDDNIEDVDTNQLLNDEEDAELDQIMNEDDDDEILDRALEDDASEEMDYNENETLDGQNQSEEKDDILEQDHESDQDVIDGIDVEQNETGNVNNYNDQAQYDDEDEYDQARGDIELDNDYNQNLDDLNNFDMESSAKINAEEYNDNDNDDANMNGNDDDNELVGMNEKPQMDEIDIAQHSPDRDLSALNDDIINDEHDNNDNANVFASDSPKSKEIGVQTILLSTEIKLSSKTKKRIALELGQFPQQSIASSKIKRSSMSPIMASRQMRSSSQKIAKIIGEHKAQLKVIFDRYSNGLTNKIKLDGLTRMLKDRNILKKISLVPEITKAFHKSSFSDKSPESLNFDEFLQCIIRMANDLLSRKKKSKYKSAESRVSLFLAKLHLRPFPKENELDNLSSIVSKDKMNDPNKKSIGSELTPNNQINANGMPSMQFDYRLSEKQLDSEFDLYFNTGGFFSDANSSVTGSTDVAPLNAANLATNNLNNQNKANPLSPSFKKVQRTNKPNGAISKRLQRNVGKKRIVKNKKVKPSPLMQKKRMTKSKKVKNVRSSYQTLHHQPPPQNNMNMNGQLRQQQMINNNMMYAQNEYAHQQPVPPSYGQPMQYQQQQQTMMSPNGSNPNYMKPGYQRQSSNSYSDYYEPQRQLLHHHQQQQLQHNNMQSPQQVPYGGYNDGGRAMNHNLTEQEQQLVQSINQRQRNHLNRAVQQSHRTNSRRHR